MVRRLTRIQEDELVRHLNKTTAESFLNLASFRGRVRGQDIEGNELGHSSKNTLHVPSDSIRGSDSAHLTDIIEE